MLSSEARYSKSLIPLPISTAARDAQNNLMELARWKAEELNYCRAQVFAARCRHKLARHYFSSPMEQGPVVPR